MDTTYGHSLTLYAVSEMPFSMHWFSWNSRCSNTSGCHILCQSRWNETKRVYTFTPLCGVAEYPSPNRFSWTSQLLKDITERCHIPNCTEILLEKCRYRLISALKWSKAHWTYSDTCSPRICNNNNNNNNKNLNQISWKSHKRFSSW